MNVIRSQTAFGQSVWLTATTALLWFILIVPGIYLGGITAIEGMTIAALLCLLPGWLVFCVLSRYRVSQNSPGMNTQALAVLLGTVVRMLFVVLGMIVVEDFRSHLAFWNFRIWLGVFYFVMLWVETMMLLRRPNVSDAG